jgi:hypothetical protein
MVLIQKFEGTTALGDWSVRFYPNASSLSRHFPIMVLGANDDGATLVQILISDQLSSL